MRKLVGAIIVILATFGAHLGCGSESAPATTTPIDGGGAAEDAGGTSSEANPPTDANGMVDARADADETNDAGVDLDAALLAPLFDTLESTDGGLALTWINNTPSCDGVEAWRKDALALYALVLTSPGNATMAKDPSANQPRAYTYHLRCKKGASYSPFSNELSVIP